MRALAAVSALGDVSLVVAAAVALGFVAGCNKTGTLYSRHSNVQYVLTVNPL